MAVNDTRSMLNDFHQGAIDRTYIQLTPDRGNVENPPVSRMGWPTYDQAEEHVDPAFIESHLRRGVLPKERRSADYGDPRY